MTIFEIQVVQGRHDLNLIQHIQKLDYILRGLDGGCGLSEREEETLQILWDRLDEITKPA